MKTITALLVLNLVCGAIYHFMVVRELNTEIYVQSELYKACTAEMMWQEMQIRDLKVSR